MSGGGTAPRDADADEQIIQDPTLPDPSWKSPRSNFDWQMWQIDAEVNLRT
jgi:hypothetical protein